MTMEWKTVEILRKMLLEQNKNPFSQATTLFYCAKSKEKTKQAKCITFSISSEENEEQEKWSSREKKHDLEYVY